MEPSKKLLLACAIGGGLAASSCEAPGVGDPCLPEALPESGARGQTYTIESPSLQCRTRVCLALDLVGDPEARAGQEGYISPADREERSYCSCKCGGPDLDSVQCACPEDFECCDVATLGSPQTRGSYCVRQGTCDVAVAGP